MGGRWVSADEAVKVVASGQSVFLGSACGEPQELVDALVRRGPGLRNVRLLTGLQGSKAPYVRPDLVGHFRLRTFMASTQVAEAIQRGEADYIPAPLSRIPELMRSGRLPVDVALVQVAPADEQGRFSLGVSVAYAKAAVDAASVVVAEVNEQMPRTLGDSFIDADAIDFLVASDRPVLEVRRVRLDQAVARIGEHVASLVPNRATMQVGIGGIADAVWSALHRHRDLGVHSGSVADNVVELLRDGVITNRFKSVDPGCVVAGQLIGTASLYRFADKNVQFSMRACDYTHEPRVLASLDRLVSVNSAVQIDLRGQVNAETLRGRQIAGVGGAMDFTVGARLSSGGRSIVALPATAGEGRHSRIVGRLDDGVVTTPSSMVDFVVTEFGIADLAGLDLDARAQALAAIAAPEHRAPLLRGQE
jgi:4-hydroxybutyrate CoA-transferase